jgi:hypothetical protein
MAKISRKAFIKANEAVMETGKSFVGFVDHCKKIHKFFMAEIERLNDRIDVLEGKKPAQPAPEITKPSE